MGRHYTIILLIWISVMGFGVENANADLSPSLVFDGGDWVNCGSSIDFNLQEVMTFEAWINFSALSGRMAVLSKDQGGGNNVPKFFLCAYATSATTCQTAFHVNGPGGNNGGSWVFSPNWTPQFGTWYHIAVVKQGSSYTFFLNGASQGTEQMTYSPPPINYPFLIGKGEGYYFHGGIDEVRVWNVARTEAEIAETMFTQLTGDEPGLIGYWPFSEGEGQVTADASGGDNTGQLGSTPDPDSNDPLWSTNGPQDVSGVDRFGSVGGPHLLFLHSYPNPFNPRTTIAFEIPRQESVTLRVFDMAGRLVRNLITAELHTPGRHEVVWNGRDDSGRQVASGTYFYRLEAGSFSETKRMVLVK